MDLLTMYKEHISLDASLLLTRHFGWQRIEHRLSCHPRMFVLLRYPLDASFPYSRLGRSQDGKGASRYGRDTPRTRVGYHLSGTQLQLFSPRITPANILS